MVVIDLTSAIIRNEESLLTFAFCLINDSLSVPGVQIVERSFQMVGANFYFFTFFLVSFSPALLYLNAWNRLN